MDWNAYKQRLHELIEQECAASRMNNTRWIETVRLVRDLRLRSRVKLLTRPEPAEWGQVWSPAPPAYIESTHVGPVLALEVEWMEVEPFQRRRRGSLVADQLIDQRESLEHGLQAIGVPYEWVDEVIRITGHVRKSQGPDGR
jgi:hypothetical protein